MILFVISLQPGINAATVNTLHRLTCFLVVLRSFERLKLYSHHELRIKGSGVAAVVQWGQPVAEHFLVFL
jgi:hypothetical protein